MLIIEVVISLVLIGLAAFAGYRFVDRDPHTDENEWLAAGIFALLAVGVMYIFWSAVNGISNIFATKWWFDTMGYDDRWATQFSTQLTLWIVGFVATFFVLLISEEMAYWLAPYQAPADRKLSRFPKWAGVIGAIIVAIFFAGGLSGMWQTVLLYNNQQPFGRIDPIYGKDLGYYVFSLPFFESIRSWLFWLLWATVIFTGLHYGFLATQADKDLVDSDRLITAGVRHGSFFAGWLFLIFGIGRWLHRYWLVVDGSNNSKLTGASIVDVTWKMPLNAIFAVVAIAVSLLFLYQAVFYRIRRTPARASIDRGSRRSSSNSASAGASIPVAPLFGFIALTVTALLVALIPWIYYHASVVKNEADAESKYIGYQIAGTYDGYALTGMETRTFSDTTALKGQDLQPLNDVLSKMRIQDWKTVQKVNNSDQYVVQPYGFNDTDIDRYAGRQVFISLREANLANLPANAKGSWINEHLAYTHGYGYTIAAVNETAGDGGPVYLVKYVDPKNPLVGPKEMMVTRPEIYFGEYTSDYTIVRTSNAEVTLSPNDKGYQGNAGVRLDGWTRLIYALAWNDYNLWQSPKVTSDSLLFFNRTPFERISALAPFLQIDSDIYPVVGGDQVLFVADGYTRSENFPYSQDGFYARNSIKAVQGAYDGSVSLYQFDQSDPIINTWMRIFPGLIKPGKDIPAIVKPHLRYPEGLYVSQSNVLHRYHITTPLDFYNGSRQWAQDQELYGTDLAVEAIEPRYIEYKLPGEKDNDFILAMPFTTVAGQQNTIPNLSGWMAGRVEDTGNHLVLYDFPSTASIYSVLKVDNEINGNGAISPILSLLNGAGSKVYWGATMSFPVQRADGNGTILYIKPLYVQGSFNGKEGIPKISRVFVILGTSIADGTTLNEALANMYAGRFRADLNQPPNQPAGQTPSNGPQPPTAPISGTITVSGTIDTTGLTSEEVQALQQLIDAMRKSHGR